MKFRTGNGGEEATGARVSGSDDRALVVAFEKQLAGLEAVTVLKGFPVVADHAVCFKNGFHLGEEVDGFCGFPAVCLFWSGG